MWNDSSRSGYCKDAFHERVVEANAAAVNPAHTGTKAAVWYALQIPAGGRSQIQLRLCKRRAREIHSRISTAILQTRLREADEFYAQLQQGVDSADARSVQRQAFAGMIWSKQFFYYDVPEWLQGDPAQPPPPPERRHGRNRDWTHLNNADVISMPDKWEYPWYAAWDLAFHCIPLAHDRPRVRQGAARPADARVVHASQRPDPRPTSGPSAT